MITAKKLEVYSRYGGSIDGYLIHNEIEDRDLTNDWGNIESLLQDNYLIEQGLTSEEYKHSTEIRLRTLCDSEETMQLIVLYAKNRKL